jgi:hypothetical protein
MARYAHLASDRLKAAASAVSEHLAALMEREEARRVLNFPK